ncbi:MAG: metallophosphoesterase [Gammaproteobacteria bacterium]|nr:metallophosphoesterase [Gammaproteobacteria bacterium]MDH5691897.1 metallophosphoesterase [Gammaproteobacteria bacterium]
MQALRLSKNLKGRDFVVGDIHGHFDLLQQFLDQVQFDTKADRLISVGDLIDRGPQSLLAAQFLSYDWFYAVRGNHETLMLDSLAEVPGIQDVWLQVGGNWSQFASTDELALLASMITELPWAIEIETDRGPVGIVHADVPAELSWTELFERISSGKMNDKELNTLIWSRNRYRQLSLSLLYPETEPTLPVEGAHRIYVGHSIVGDHQVFGNVVFLDTGAFSGGKLTIIDLATEEPIIINNEFNLQLDYIDTDLRGQGSY